MHAIGNKIRKIRELKNLAPKDIADKLDMTPQGYLKIERDEVNLTIDRLLQLSDLFGMKPEDILTFDEKMIFNNNAEIKSSIQGVNNGTFNNFPDEVRNLYDDKVKLLEDKLLYQQDKLKWQEEKIAWLEKRLRDGGL